jgi:Flp pilus assembly pilin Flp
MNNALLKMAVTARNLIDSEEGNSLIEYSLIAAVVSIGALALMGSVVGGINTAFQDVLNALVPATP